jgi:hypothetical protein
MATLGRNNEDVPREIVSARELRAEFLSFAVFHAIRISLFKNGELQHVGINMKGPVWQ